MEDNEPLILTIDFGTQSVRASIFNQRGNSLAMEKEVYAPAYFSSEPGFAEQDPAYYFDCLCKCTKRLAESHPELIKNVKGITQTCFRDSAVLLDKDNKVIRPMVLWLDQRMAKCEKPLPLTARMAFALVGKGETIRLNRQRTVSNWIIENEPGNWAKVNKYLSVSTYFIFRLTGQMKDSSASQIGHYPIDFKHRCWYKNPETNLQGQVFSLKKSMLCEIVPEGSLIGGINKVASEETGLPEGLPVFACGADKSCETLGSGVIDSTMAAISLGTACTVETTTEKFLAPAPFLPAYPSVVPTDYNMDIQIYRGFWMINWFLKEFGAKNIKDIVIDDVDADDYNAELFKIPAGSDGLILQPYWGPGLDRPLVKGAVVGFSDNITREHFYKAIIEGIDYSLREAAEGFEKTLKHPFASIRISGGGSRSNEICQIAADVFGKPVARVQTNETSSLGAAMSGFLSIGTFKNTKEAADAMVHVQDVFTPDSKNHEKYNDLFYNSYMKMYPSLKGIYKNLIMFGRKNGRY